MTDIHGFAAAHLGPVKDVFAANFADGQERGARFTVVQDGETVLDLWAGSCDRGGEVPFTDKTLVPVFSSTKAVTALMIARLVDQGKLDYEATVASYWPEFGQNGKDQITLGQLISHQGGIPGFDPPRAAELWFDIPAVLAAICEQAPLWAPGEGSGYHPYTTGFVLGELFRRVDGRTLGTALREDIAGKYGLDLYIGTPESEFDRISDLQKPSAVPNFGEVDDIKKAAFLNKGAFPGGRGSEQWRSLEMPSANGHATSEALAKFMNIIATGGFIDGDRVISLSALGQALRERVYGPDRVLPFKLSWAAGFLRNKNILIYGKNERAVGHSGNGGSMVMADPDKKLSAAYVMNKQSNHLIGDPRSVRLMDALYETL
ncbi:serine hydrolase domain-containing protein [Asticcacaulis endophyticus]|uniref:Esterase n=1 Tax=Asticcacaulis endophyticus TaxID=1395890 RepID=A0A918PX10_9CAUL|nr:serine hydrolase domain-containing protein [Asticcacaulis endophyticus]GGZ26239.1 esterase [Asticcacaulis endophyticus]